MDTESLLKKVKVAVRETVLVELKKQRAKLEGFPVMQIWSRVYRNLDLSDIIESMCQ